MTIDPPEARASAVTNRLFALIGVLTISFSAVWVALSGTSPTTAATFRAMYALPVLVLLAPLLQRNTPPASRRTRYLAFTAGLALGLDFVVWHESIERIGAGLATAIGNIQVILVGAVAWVLLKEKPRFVTFLTMPVVAAGLVLVAGVGSSDPQGTDPVGGAIFGVLTAFFYMVFLLLFRQATQQAPATAGPLRDATAGALVCSLALAPLDGGFSLTPTWPGHGWLLALALGSQVVGWLLIARSMPRLPALDTSVTLLLQPAAALLWGAWILDERLAVLQWVGILLVGVGIAVVIGRGAIETRPVNPVSQGQIRH